MSGLVNNTVRKRIVYECGAINSGKNMLDTLRSTDPIDDPETLGCQFHSIRVLQPRLRVEMPPASAWIAPV